MIAFLLSGGVPMVGILVCGLAALVAAVRFAMVPDARKIGSITSLTIATVASSLLGTAADLAVVASFGRDVAAGEDAAKLPIVLMTGFSESMSPIILGFGIVTAIWLVMAVGHRRLVPRLAA